jgi:hypothetical protein
VDVAFPSTGPITWAEIADYLDWCAERIIRFGWVQGTEMFRDRVCAVGAFRLRSEQLGRRMAPIRADNLGQRAMYALNAHLHTTTGGGFSNIPSWNDHPNRTMTEVIAAFRDTARGIRELNGISA